MTRPFDVEPGPRHAELDAMIRAAREQSAPAVGVLLEDIRDAASARRSIRWWGGLAAAAVVVASLWAVRASRPEVNSAKVAFAGEEPEGFDEPIARRRVARIPDVSPMLDGHARVTDSVSIEPLEGTDSPTPSEGGVMALVDGRYRVRTADAATSVSVEGRVLEIAAASDVFVDARVEHSSFRVVKGEANWVESEKGSVPQPGLGAKQLASRAEAALLAGRHEDAVRLLRRLVQAHPRGATTKAALIDLAGLEKRLGRPGRAHCAYSLFSKRFPMDARAPTVRRADDALGHAPRCRGLRPASK